MKVSQKSEKIIWVSLSQSSECYRRGMSGESQPQLDSVESQREKQERVCGVKERMFSSERRVSDVEEHVDGEFKKS